MSTGQNHKQPPPPFAFYKAAYLLDATTLKALSLSQLSTGVTLAEEMSIFYHLHCRFFANPEILLEYPNDFAYWVGEDLGNWVVAEDWPT
ncbi:MAG TPA: DUF5752 family protein [Candidatus Binatia bacterium]|jgi:hypothetical protein|nr:DUF5752 family protein [Candidatus Binatia bacterium]